MNVPEMVAKYDLKPLGVIQVGSHHGEEIPVWNSMGIRQVHFEPIQSNWEVLKARWPEVNCFPFALGNRDGTAEMKTETVNGGQSCSVLEPRLHKTLLPWIEFNGTEHVRMMKLDHVVPVGMYNFMYVDVQGYELEVFKGAGATLMCIDFIFTEVNRAEVFEGCAKIEELDAFLGERGFRRVETEWHGGDFGDSLYVK